MGKEKGVISVYVLDFSSSEDFVKFCFDLLKNEIKCKLVLGDKDDRLLYLFSSVDATQNYFNEKMGNFENIQKLFEK